ncbi:MAG: Nramp family divalent metal transporter [Candidatus Woesearchaeota archaeon]
MVQKINPLKRRAGEKKQRSERAEGAAYKIRIGLSERFRALFLMLSLVGPGLITAFADNDAGGVSTYSVAGATLGYNILWSLLPVTVLLIIVQEMSARLGIVTGKGLADLIRERYGVKITLFLMIGLFLANISTTIGDFAGIAASGDLFNIPRWVIVPLTAIILLLIMIKGDYRTAEKAMFILIFFYITYVLAGIMAKPNWSLALKSTFLPKIEFTPTYIYILVGVIGTTITPWMQFYLQSTYVEKGISVKDYRFAKAEVILSSIVSDSVSFFMILTCAATLYYAGISINSAQEAALALKPLAGEYAYILFGVGLFFASSIGAILVPVSTSFSICEGIGFESGLNKTMKEAPVFYGLLIATVVISAGLVLIPNLPLIKIMVFSQVFSGMVLPFIMIATLRIVNDEKLMGEYVNSKGFNIIAYAGAYLVILMTAYLVYMSVRTII